jgi:hypothetical protein
MFCYDVGIVQQQDGQILLTKACYPYWGLPYFCRKSFVEDYLSRKTEGLGPETSWQPPFWIGANSYLDFENR